MSFYVFYIHTHGTETESAQAGRDVQSRNAGWDGGSSNSREGSTGTLATALTGESLWPRTDAL